MSYNWITKYNSPNYTPENRVQATWGRPRTIEAISIHWWGDPNQNPSFEGVVSVLTNPSRGASAHLVASGTGRKVACLVNFQDASWATNSANPYTISIECDPRCRDEDYDVIAELIAQLRQVYGDLPLVPHKQFVATACPGNYDLGRLDRESRNKVAKAEWDWGHVENKVVTPPAPTKPTWVKMDNPRSMVANVNLHVFDLVKSANVGDVIKKNTPIEFQTKADWKGKLYLRSRSSTEGKRDWGIEYDKLREMPVVEPPVEPEKPIEPEAPEKPSNDGFNENDRNTLLSIKEALEWLRNAFKAIFKI